MYLIGGIRISFPDSLKRFRQEFKITQKQAAQGAGVVERLYQKYEHGEVAPSVLVVMKLADTFGVSTDYLLGRTDSPNMRSA